MTDVQQRPMPWPPPDPGKRSGPEAAAEEIPKSSWIRLAILLAVTAFVGIRWGWWAIAVILGFVLMLFVHELGHYLAARRAGMKVTEFFLGFGPRIWSFRRGEVQYGFKAIPLGAYVRIIGMNNLEEVPPADEARTYRAKGYWSRFCVAVAGVAMNFALGARAAVRRPRRLRRAPCRHLVREQRQPRQPRRGGRARALRPHPERRRAVRGHLRRAHRDHPGQARARRSPSSSSATVSSSPRSSPSPSAGPTRPSASASSASARPTPTRRSAR